ncbi:MAG: LL-diaminopimelate aminotransferase [Desulfovibrionaceae bacterium]|nr:LL-diaminopimelate aminotransferase [Desulfovibrionaceae bacterium]
MIQSNENYAKMPGSYLFATVAAKVRAHRESNPALPVISLGIGDVTSPLVPAVTSALHAAVEEMGQADSFRGYGPEQGYAFLREAIARHDYRSRGVNVDADDIFISDGSKCDVGNIQELFSLSCRVAVTDPVYPVYVDSNAMAGRAGDWIDGRWSRLTYLPCTAENGFVPDFPTEAPDVIYLCYPNNPTGTVLSRDALAAWVDYARAHRALIVYDAAYEAYIHNPDVPHSIFEIPGAEEVAVECRSFSNTAGFTGLRCAFTVIPGTVRIAGPNGKDVSLREMWRRRQSTKYNGCPYIVQRAAEAIYTPEGAAQIRGCISGYMDNAARIREGVSRLGLECWGGVDAPYIWVRTPGGMGSWEFFALLLSQASLVCTPGEGFGPCGAGYVRFTAFGTPEQTAQALERLGSLSL